MKKRLSINWFKEPTGLCENYQQTGILFAFASAPVDGTYTMCHEWVKCRDYLHDVVRTELTGEKSVIYGFQFDREKNPRVDLKKMRMLVAKDLAKEDPAETAVFKRKMTSSLELLRHFEKIAGVTLSRMSEADVSNSKKKAVVMFSSSPMWLKSPSLVSLYTFIIRLGDKEIEFTSEEDLKAALKKAVDDYLTASRANGKDDNDLNYLVRMHDKLHGVVKNRKSLFKMKNGFHDLYFTSNSINYFHNNAGILSLCTASTPDVELNNAVKKLLHSKQESSK